MLGHTQTQIPYKISRYPCMFFIYEELSYVKRNHGSGSFRSMCKFIFQKLFSIYCSIASEELDVSTLIG